MKTIALFDNYRGGHHLTYLRLFSQTLLEMGYRVIAFCQEPDEVSEWVTLHCPKQAHYFHIFKVEEVKAPKFPLIGELPRTCVVLAQWKYAAKVIQKAVYEVGHAPDLVFFAWLDSYLSDYLTHHIIDLIFPYTWSGLYFTPNYLKFGRRFLPIIGTPLSPYIITKSPRCCSIALLNETEAKTLQHQIKTPVIAFPDITDESPPDSSYSIVKEIREKAGKRKIVGLVGHLTKRKGLLTLLEVAQNLGEEDLFFVFAGQFYDYDLPLEEVAKVENFVASQPSNCFFYLERIPDEAQFNTVINTCDILFAAYNDFPYSSNILTKAAVFEKPVIVSDGFCMSERVKAFGLGMSIPQGDVVKCIEVLHYLSKELDSNASTLKPDFEGYRRIHSVQRLCTAFHSVCDNAEVLNVKKHVSKSSSKCRLFSM